MCVLVFVPFDSVFCVHLGYSAHYIFRWHFNFRSSRSYQTGQPGHAGGGKHRDFSFVLFFFFEVWPKTGTPGSLVEPSAMVATSPITHFHWPTPSQTCRWPHFTRVHPFLAIQRSYATRFSAPPPIVAGLLDLDSTNSPRATYACSRVCGLGRGIDSRYVFGRRNA